MIRLTSTSATIPGPKLHRERVKAVPKNDKYKNHALRWALFGYGGRDYRPGNAFPPTRNGRRMAFALFGLSTL